MKIIFLILFITLCILDPSNTVFKLKELTFCLFAVFSFGEFMKSFNAPVFVSSLFLSVVFPLVFLLIGFVVNSNFSLDVAIATFKVFLFAFLINFLIDDKYEYVSIFSKLTLLIVPTTSIILISLLTDKFEMIDGFLGEYYNTVMIATREFGSVTFLMIYYKTVSLLLFGLAFCLTRKSSLKLNLLIFLICLTLFFSATRAIYLSLFFILVFHAYKKWFSLSVSKKYLFIILIIVSCIAVLPSVLAAFFDKNEDSNSIKLGFIGEYIELWKNNPLLLFSGHGLGSGMYTSERGLTYNLETTYFELFRIFGFWGGCILIIVLFYPIIVGYFGKLRLNSSQVDIYFLIAYFCYVFFVIPSNPLFLSSTGVLVVSIAYSLVYKRNKRFSI